jgi:pimeloyl-ACP methyl ester carboxylesterase
MEGYNRGRVTSKHERDDKLKTEYASLEGIQIAYTQFGEGLTLLLLHGNSESKGIFKQYQTQYFTMFHTFALDSRGHGESKSTDEEYSIKQYSEDVINFCKAQQISQAYVIGYSDGGNIVLFLASKAPELFPRLVAISPNYLVSGTTDGALRLVHRLYRLAGFLNRLGFNLKKSMMRVRLMLTDIGISEAELRDIRTHLKIIYAENDVIKEEHLRHLAALVRNSSLDKVAGTNHMTILNNPETIDLMKGFFLGTNQSPEGDR